MGEGVGVEAGLCSRGGRHMGGASPGGRREGGAHVHGEPGHFICFDQAVFRWWIGELGQEGQFAKGFICQFDQFVS